MAKRVRRFLRDHTSARNYFFVGKSKNEDKSKLFIELVFKNLEALILQEILRRNALPFPGKPKVKLGKAMRNEKRMTNCQEDTYFQGYKRDSILGKGIVSRT